VRTDPLYAAPPADHLIAAPLDGLTALYHRMSTMTHVLVEPAPQIISALQGTSLSVSDLLKALDLSDADAPVLTERLQELEASGLVVRR
jgi:PqqD family protein of HPr-rel-A system